MTVRTVAPATTDRRRFFREGGMAASTGAANVRAEPTATVAAARACSRLSALLHKVQEQNTIISLFHFTVGGNGDSNCCMERVTLRSVAQGKLTLHGRPCGCSRKGPREPWRPLRKLNYTGHRSAKYLIVDSLIE
jgi:hypothetical protein